MALPRSPSKRGHEVGSHSLTRPSGPGETGSAVLAKSTGLRPAPAPAPLVLGVAGLGARSKQTPPHPARPVPTRRSYSHAVALDYRDVPVELAALLKGSRLWERSVSAQRLLGGMEAEAVVSADPLVVHASQDRNFDVDVVVRDHTGLGRCRPQDPAYVLDDAALEPDRERQEDGVEGRAIKALA